MRSLRLFAFSGSMALKLTAHSAGPPFTRNCGAMFRPHPTVLGIRHCPISNYVVIWSQDTNLDPITAIDLLIVCNATFSELARLA